MPRPRSPHWHDRDRCYYTKLDGHRVMLRHPDGTKVAHGDARGIREAVERMLAERDASVRRTIEPTVNDLCREYLIAASRETTLETMSGKEWILTKFCSFGTPPHGERPAREIDATDLHRMRKDWERQGYAGNMLRRLYREVLACWAWAARPEPERTPLVILERNPLAKMRLPAPTPSKAKYVPMEQVRPIIEFAERRAGGMPPVLAHFERQAVLMLRLLAETGCRPKEACAARWEDFDAGQGLIVLDAGRHKTGKKTGKPRVIVVPPEIAAELVALRDSGKAHPVHLFAHRRSRGESSTGAGLWTGAAWQRPSYTAWFCRLVREASASWSGEDGAPTIPEGITLYWLRHSYLTDAQLSEGAERAADLAGNTKEIARGTYLHVQASQLRAAAERVAARRAAQAPVTDAPAPPSPEASSHQPDESRGM